MSGLPQASSSWRSIESLAPLSDPDRSHTVLVSRQLRTQPTFRVLLVCTGNICRSAIAERLGRAHVREVLAEDASLIRLTSAGVRAVSGSAMHPQSAMALESLGGDPAGFQARQVDEAMILEADLVLTMTFNQRRRVLELAPRALSRTFTLREAAGLVSLLGAELGVPGDDLPARARAVVGEMARARARRRTSDADDVRDPVSSSPDVHQAVAETIADVLLPLLTRIAELRRRAPPGPSASDAA